MKKSLIIASSLILSLVILTNCGKSQDSNFNANSTTSNGSTKEIKGGYVGKIIKTPEGSQFDDYFKTADGEYGILALAEPIKTKLIELRDLGQEIILWGELIKDVSDYGGRQILVNKIAIPADNFFLAWQVEKNENLGISFQYPEKTFFEINNNAIVFEGWELEIFNNPKSLEFKDWVNLNFSESKEESCQISPTTVVILGAHETYEVAVSSTGKCQRIGFFTISPDKQKIIKLLLAETPNQNYQEIIKTLRFIKTLPKDKIDLNQSKNNGNNGEQAETANPASLYCQEQGGQLELRTDKKSQGQYGVCIFSNGSECEEWAYYRGECRPGNNKSR